MERWWVPILFSRVFFPDLPHSENIRSKTTLRHAFGYFFLQRRWWMHLVSSSQASLNSSVGMPSYPVALLFCFVIDWDFVLTIFECWTFTTIQQDGEVFSPPSKYADIGHQITTLVCYRHETFYYVVVAFFHRIFGRYPCPPASLALHTHAFRHLSLFLCKCVVADRTVPRYTVCFLSTTVRHFFHTSNSFSA